MRVLFSTYSLAFQNPGGGEQVLLRLKEGLENANHTVDLFDPWDEEQWKSLDQYDLVHSFSCVEPSRWAFFKKRLPKTPLVVTPTLWTPPEAKGFLSRLKSTVAPDPLVPYLKLVDRWLPTTEMESQGLSHRYGIAQDKKSVLRNGIGDQYLVPSEKFASRINQPYLLHVGRFDPVKQQRELIVALSNAPVRVVFAGGEDPQYRAYYQQCVDLAQKAQHAKFVFLGRLDPGSDELVAAYQNASALVIPSRFETFGLVAFEALAVGCPHILMTSECGMRDRLSEWPSRVTFISPQNWATWNLKCVAHCVRKAISKSTQNQTFERLRSQYSWDGVVRDLLGIYEKSRYTMSGNT